MLAQRYDGLDDGTTEAGGSAGDGNDGSHVENDRLTKGRYEVQEEVSVQSRSLRR